MRSSWICLHDPLLSSRDPPVGEEPEHSHGWAPWSSSAVARSGAAGSACMARCCPPGTPPVAEEPEDNHGWAPWISSAVGPIWPPRLVAVRCSRSGQQASPPTRVRRSSATCAMHAHAPGSGGGQGASSSHYLAAVSVSPMSRHGLLRQLHTSNNSLFGNSRVLRQARAWWRCSLGWTTRDPCPRSVLFQFLRSFTLWEIHSVPFLCLF